MSGSGTLKSAQDLAAAGLVATEAVAALAPGESHAVAITPAMAELTTAPIRPIRSRGSSCRTSPS